VTGYKVINLAEVIKLKKDENAKAERAYQTIINAISAFSCPLNEDVENFLKRKAVTFSEQGLAATFLVFASHKETPVLIGYFTISNKFLQVPRKRLESNSWRRRIAKFSKYNEDLRSYELSLPLIAQLGKNYSNEYNKLISGDELLQIACNKVCEVLLMSSGKLTYVECEDKECLVNFYSSNGFRRFADRPIGKSEEGGNGSSYLVQMIKYLDTMQTK